MISEFGSFPSFTWGWEGDICFVTLFRDHCYVPWITYLSLGLGLKNLSLLLEISSKNICQAWSPSYLIAGFVLEIVRSTDIHFPEAQESGVWTFYFLCFSSVIKIVWTMSAAFSLSIYLVLLYSPSEHWSWAITVIIPWVLSNGNYY